METPTLNKKQQRSSLSAKKGRPKETIKNVLATPYSTLYWPEIKPEDYAVLKEILEQNLPKITVNVKVPWQDLKNIPRPERKKFKEEYVRNNQKEINKNDRKGVIIGINTVTKMLEKNEVSAILISHDVQPKLMVQHVIDQAVLYQVPILIFNDLRRLLKEVCGVGSTVLGISKAVSPDSNLGLVSESIKQIFDNCPAPVKHINYNRALDQVANEVIITQSDTEENKPDLDEDKVKDDEFSEPVYLIRNSKRERVFIPENSQRTLRNDKMEVDSAGFLAFSEEPSPKVKEKVKPSYKSLIVKRLKGDPNRNKKKINTLKRKRK